MAADTRPFVSVVVRTYNRPERLRECLQSLTRQTYSDYEIVIVNDGGMDVAAILEDELAGHRYQYVCNPTNYGRTPALNVGIEATSGDYVAFLDDDDGVLPHHLQTLVNTALPEKLPVVYSDVINVTFQKDETTGEWKRVQEQLVYSFDFASDNFLLANYIPINCLLIRRDCFDAVGPFDESLSVYEDWEFLIRLSRKFEFKHVATVTGEYRRRDDNSNILEQESYPENEKVVKRRYRDDRDAIFDEKFKSTFALSREIRQRTAQLEQIIRQNQIMQQQLRQAQQTVQQIQQQLHQSRGGQP